ncbi:hypothetical protein AB0T83_10260 [Fluviibacterium sp. DFM31]|uniref:Uncharacterized protein n=1 Tax=Meridianimarinicoccus marinus TaxID=3231483 RepID=A0ABV3L6L1_9RHOB
MKAMFLAFAAVIVIAFAADQILQRAGFSAAERTSGDSVRLE